MNREISYRLPDSPSSTIVYLHTGRDALDAVWNLLPEPKPVLVCIGNVDWNRDLTPWPAPKAFRGGENFGGEADAYLRELTEEIIPDTENRLSIKPDVRCLAGYSLGGLFAVYAVCRCDCFNRIASMSGSLWFDGFREFLPQAGLHRIPDRAYFSIGDREKETKSPRMACNESCTLDTVEFFRQVGCPTDFRMESGGHFQDVPARIARGIAAITKP